MMIVPKLRFPEFRNAGAWDLKPLNSLGKTISGLSGKSGTDFGSGKPFVTYKQVFDCSRIDFSKCSRVEVSVNEKQNELRKGDVLFTTSSETPDEVGFSSVLLDAPAEPTYLNSFCFSFRPNDENLLKPEFSRYFFHSPVYRKAVITLAQGSTRFNISKIAFLNLILPVPKKIQEQNKIADCLSSIDELISAQSEKVEALKTHKKGLMQRLFPKYGETIPRLRFPEFRDAGEWAETQLNQVAIRCKQKNSLNKLNRVLTNSAEFGVLDQRDFFDKDIANQSNLDGYYIVKKGDYVYNPRISKTAPVGPISKNNIGDGVMSPLYTVFRFNNYDNSFYAHYFNSTCWHHYMRQSSSTGARHDRMAITNDDFMALPVPITSAEEQQKIANCLSSIDELISAHSQKLDTLKTHKKGLMQQLFPATDEANTEVGV